MSTMADTKTRASPADGFTDEFKAEAVRLVLDEGKSVGAVARESRSDGVSASQRGSSTRRRIAPRARTG